MAKQVICINAKPLNKTGNNPPLKEGHVYTATSCQVCPDCKVLTYDIGLVHPSGSTRHVCSCGYKTHIDPGDTWYVAAKRFADLEEYQAQEKQVNELIQGLDKISSQ